jgi:hypothetical protein
VSLRDLGFPDRSIVAYKYRRQVCLGLIKKICTEKEVEAKEIAGKTKRHPSPLRSSFTRLGEIPS